MAYAPLPGSLSLVPSHLRQVKLLMWSARVTSLTKPLKTNFHAYLILRRFVESKKVLRKVPPVRRHAINLGWAFLMPSFGKSHMCHHLFSIRTISRTPFVPIECIVDALSLIDENVATRLCFCPSVQRIPASTHAGLMEASVLVLGLCGIHRRVVCIAKDVL